MNNDLRIEDNYLVIDCGEIGYKLRMLEANRIRGLLRLEIREQDDSRRLYYDISSMETFDSIVGSRTLQMDDIRALILSISRTVRNLENYLLDADDLIIDRKYMYISGDRLEPVFCCCPGHGKKFSAGLSSLLQDLLGMVDSTDRSAVVSIYSLYQMSMKSTYGMEDLVDIVNRNTMDTEKGKIKESDSSVRETVQYKDDNLEVISVSGVDDEDSRTAGDMDELYTSLNADPKKYHFGMRNKKQDEENNTKKKKGLGFLR
ncbi:MAG: hypothetical protein KBS51_02140 [Lachnospiraceae bacterium]|nr:hypothetical protein [Candidatus Darwinimomas equi]